MWARTWGKGGSCAAGGGVSWCSRCGEQYGGSSETYDQNPRIGQQSTSQDFSEEKNCRKISAPHVPCSIVPNGQDTGATRVCADG